MSVCQNLFVEVLSIDGSDDGRISDVNRGLLREARFWLNSVVNHAAVDEHEDHCQAEDLALSVILSLTF